MNNNSDVLIIMDSLTLPKTSRLTNAVHKQLSYENYSDIRMLQAVPHCFKFGRWTAESSGPFQKDIAKG